MSLFYRILLFYSIITLLSFPATGNTINEKFVVVLDPGHGGNDPGAVGRKGKEKNINLNVAIKLGKLIESKCNDTKVVYTRKTDKFVPLHKRAEIANNAKANLFISIHTNAVARKNSHVRGTETYTLGLHRTEENLEVAKKENSVILIEDDYKQKYAGFNPNSSESYIIFEFMQDKNMAQSVNFATLIQKHFKGCNRIDKGVHQAGFLVLRETSMPSVLVELGYISNPSEETYLLSEKGTSSFNIISPVSMPTSMYIVVIPVFLSPFSTAHCIGAAPLYCGSSEPCTLIQPLLGISNNSLGSIFP